jgi:hypothetical protein
MGNAAVHLTAVWIDMGYSSLSARIWHCQIRTEEMGRV